MSGTVCGNLHPIADAGHREMYGRPVIRTSHPDDPALAQLEQQPLVHPRAVRVGMVKSPDHDAETLGFHSGQIRIFCTTLGGTQITGLNLARQNVINQVNAVLYIQRYRVLQ
jgi:hypothetical protein